MASSPTIEPPEFVEKLLRDALAANASDIYMLPGRDALVVRCKTPAGERELAILPRDYGSQCVARVKVLASILTYRTSIAQDGAIHGRDGFEGVELRVATLPTLFGERVTIRVLTQGQTPKRLAELGFADVAVERLLRLLRRPTGLLVFTGPTGSGKTTTIYALLRELLDLGENPSSIITIEDPIECEIDGITQIQIRRDDEEWNYLQALRAALRHDVKTLVIGEMRDAEVVRVVLDAALTGHRVITTYHAGDIASVYARMLHQGFEPFLIAAAVTGVVSQRLFHSAAGEAAVPVAAVLEVDDPWRDRVIDNPGLTELRRRVAEIPGADLEAELRALIESGALVSPEKAVL